MREFWIVYASIGALFCVRVYAVDGKDIDEFWKRCPEPRRSIYIAILYMVLWMLWPLYLVRLVRAFLENLRR